MADVQIQQTPGRSPWPWVFLIIIVLLVAGWFFLGQPTLFREKTDININSGGASSSTTVTTST